MAQAGWYNDEHDRTLARWHDGERWTEHVVDKAAWEAYGQPPPPPQELEPWEPEEHWSPAPSRRSPLWVAAAVALVALFGGGIALARDSGDPRPHPAEESDRDPASTVDRSDRDRRLADDAGDLTGSSVDVATDPAGTSAGGSGTTSPKAGTTRTTAPASGSAVQRTETSTKSSTGPNSVTEVRKGDETSIGNQGNVTNTTNTTIRTTTTTSTPEPPTDGGDGGAPPEGTGTTG